MPEVESEDLPRNRFRADLAWNYASLIVLGVSGITLNVVIGLYYDSATLGVFNQVFAAYIFFSMLASGGLNFSVLRVFAEFADDRERRAPALCGALVPTAILSSIVAGLFWWSADSIAAWLDSEAVADGIRAASVGLFFFAFNKVLLAAVNGLRRMRAFAVYQALRYVLLLIGLLLAVRFDVPGAWLAGVFSFGEAILFVTLAIEISTQVAWWRGGDWRPWAGRHLTFGIKSVLSGILLELNSRVDILMLGYFLGDSEVGIYSYAALFAEGFFQLLVVLKNNYNPILARHISAGQLRNLEQLVRHGRNRIWPAIVAAGVVAIVLYPLALDILTNKPAFGASRYPFAILIVGIIIAAGYLPFQNTLSMANLPGWHSIFMLLVVAFNIVANAVLIPSFGIRGAAAATACAFVISVLLLRFMARRLIGLKI